MARRKTSQAASTTSTLRRRLIHIEAVLVLVACGLVWRRPELGLPAVVAKYGGSMLWGAMVFFCVAAVKPRMAFWRIAVIAAIVATLVEFSQLIHIGWLDQFRRTAVGVLLIGRTFAWWDIAAYWAGIAAAYLAATKLFRSEIKSDPGKPKTRKPKP